MAGELLMSISQNEAERAIFRSRRKFQTDYGSDMATARDNGRAERSLEIARIMLSAGEPMEKIMSYTGLTKQEITQL